MRRIRVQVLGGMPPRRPDGPIKKAWRLLRQTACALLRRPGLAILASGVAFMGFVGTPHIAWEYQCRHQTLGHASCQEALWCAYYGIEGRRVEWMDRGQPCKLITILPTDWIALIERNTQ
ncbi:MAG: hypothetical protein AAGI92_02950 [Pseudomonadota bacterium]